MWKVVSALLVTLLLAPAALADVVSVIVTGQVAWNWTSEQPLSDVGVGETATLSFTVDSNVFDEGHPGDTRGYVIDQSSFSLSFSDGVTVGLANPYPATPYFTLITGGQMSAGFFVSDSPFSQGGVQLDAQDYKLDLHLRYVSTPTSLDILDALGGYYWNGLRQYRFGFWRTQRHHVLMKITFWQMTIMSAISVDDSSWSGVKALYR